MRLWWFVTCVKSAAIATNRTTTTTMIARTTKNKQTHKWANQSTIPRWYKADLREMTSANVSAPHSHRRNYRWMLMQCLYTVMSYVLARLWKCWSLMMFLLRFSLYFIKFTHVIFIFFFHFHSAWICTLASFALSIAPQYTYRVLLSQWFDSGSSSAFSLFRLAIFSVPRPKWYSRDAAVPCYRNYTSAYNSSAPSILVLRFYDAVHLPNETILFIQIQWDDKRNILTPSPRLYIHNIHYTVSFSGSYCRS